MVLCLALLVVLLPEGSAGSPVEEDWGLVSIGSVGGSASGVEVSVTGSFEANGSSEPSIVGIGVGAPGGTRISVRGYGGGDTRLATTQYLGGVTIELQEERREGFYWFAARYRFDHMAEGVPAGIVGFVTGMELVTFQVHDVTAETGEVNAELVTGGGSRALPMVDAEDRGLGVEVGGVAVGDVRKTVEAERGVVGGFTDPTCAACTFSWETPDGRSGSYRVAEQDFDAWTFAGPSGQWSFEWSGAGAVLIGGQPTLAAWAPLGDEWEMFGPR